MPDTDADATRQRLQTLTQRIVRHVFQAGGERLRLTPITPCTVFAPGLAAAALGAQATTALAVAASHLDLEPQRYTPAPDRQVAQRRAADSLPWWPRLRDHRRLPAQRGRHGDRDGRGLPAYRVSRALAD